MYSAPLQFGNPSALVDRIQAIQEQRGRRAVFLVGSALTAPTNDSPGVPGVQEMVQLILDRFQGHAHFEAIRTHIIQSHNPYQAAFSEVIHRLGPDEANHIVQAAVLCAVNRGDDETALCESPATDQFCEALEEQLERWHINRGLQALASTVPFFPDTFERMILTTNFDPLIKIAIRRQNKQAAQRVLAQDGTIGGFSPYPFEVVHLHGYWRNSDTLHVASQIAAERPRLEASLRHILEDHLLVVIGYSGWDDVVVRSLARLASDERVHLNVIWCFLETEEAFIRQKYNELLSRLAPAIGCSRVTFYTGIDVHNIFSSIDERFTSRTMRVPRVEMLTLATARPPPAPTPQIPPTLHRRSYASSPCVLVLNSAKPEERGRLFDLSDTTSVGRGATAISLDSGYLSRCHAVFERGASGWSLVDTGSSNGTVLNGARVSGRHAVSNRDLVELGGVTLRFYESRMEAEADKVFLDQSYADPIPGIRNRLFLNESLAFELAWAQPLNGAARGVDIVVVSFRGVDLGASGIAPSAMDGAIGKALESLREIDPTLGVFARFVGATFIARAHLGAAKAEDGEAKKSKFTASLASVLQKEGHRVDPHIRFLFVAAGQDWTNLIGT